ncbi:MAG TPA: hypothetical protein VFI74_05945 [Candidatus Saccharimonadales bacterium]|nr:hypothetical protein [Candidatus Saccharimonadales bacterium]
MVAFILALVVVGIILMIAEHLAHNTDLHAEVTRKFVHMLVGTFVAFWPFFMSWRQIEIMSLLFFIVIALSVKFTFFRSIHTVPRQAVGELLFAMVIGFLALISSSEWIFMAAMLHLSLGDGAAAIIGLLYGDKNQYKVLGKTKSIAGTSAFFVTSLMIMIGYVVFSGGPGGVITLALVPIMATVTENLAINGTDNLIMPLLVAFILGGAT